jgi:hypothetical protein
MEGRESDRHGCVSAGSSRVAQRKLNREPHMPKHPKTGKIVETLKHDDATRKNIPTAEYQPVLGEKGTNADLGGVRTSKSRFRSTVGLAR